MKTLILSLCWVGCLLIPTLSATSVNLSMPESPCPAVLTYFERDPFNARSRWSANIEIRPERPLKGFKLLIELTTPAELLGNLVGEVRTRNNKHFSISTRKKLPGGQPFSIRIFVKHSSDVPLVKTIKLNDVQICPQVLTNFQTEPRRTLARPGESVTLMGLAGTPLSHCHFYVPPDYRLIDFSQGLYSLATAKYEYHGRGLDKGECGIRLKQVRYENDGAIECKVKSLEGLAEWHGSASMLRVTNASVQDLPVFEISPRRKTVRLGDNVTVTCNADRRLNLCHFYLSRSRRLNFDRGANSEATAEYRYHGDGLQYGHCGVTLLRVDDSVDGYVGCKLGRWPEQATGAWEADVMKLEVTNVGLGSFSNTGTQTDQAEPLGSIPIRDVEYDTSYDRETRTRSTTTTTTTTTTTMRTTERSTSPPSRTRRPELSNGRNVECGKTVASPPVALITHGEATYRGQWPWHVAIYQSFSNGSLLNICGGSLIGARSVVTAAHCVTTRTFDRAVNPTTLVVYAGKYSLDQWSDDSIQGKQVSRVAVHPHYNSSAGFKDDLAVLMLSSEVNYTDLVRPVCLWDANRTALEEVEGRQGSVVGWGIDESGFPTPELMKAVMPVVPFTTCLWSNPQHFLQFSRETTYCAGYVNGTSACNGDSGGGMVFPTMTSSGRRWYLRGLVSNSIPTTHENSTNYVCDTRHYIVFTDLAQYLDWLAPFTNL